MRTGSWAVMVAAIGFSAGLVGCQTTGSNPFTYKNMPVSNGTAVAGDGNKVLFQGNPLTLAGSGIKIGDPLRDV
ncbi:MAG: hypothetical protein HP495_03955, partial [Nitrospira sp.]|nr:hypothetical protein [Nitrospira sp.]